MTEKATLAQYRLEPVTVPSYLPASTYYGMPLQVTLAKYGLAPLLAACKATGTCKPFRSLFYIAAMPSTSPEL